MILYYPVLVSQLQRLLAFAAVSSWIWYTLSKLPPATFARLKAKDSSSGEMAKSEIESWIASTSSVSDDSDGKPSALPVWRRELILSDWSTALQIAQKRLLSSSTKLRTRFLLEELLSIAKYGGE